MFNCKKALLAALFAASAGCAAQVPPEFLQALPGAPAQVTVQSRAQWLAQLPLQAPSPTASRDPPPNAFPTHPEPEATRFWLPPPEWGTVHSRNIAFITTEAVLIGLYGRSTWWKSGFTENFRTVNEGWFGQNTYAGGADKLGHLYMNYVTTRLVSQLFEWNGNAPEHALRIAALTTLGTMTAVEVLDGFSRRWRFSKEDAVMNALGAGAAVLLERNSALDDIVDFRLHYRASAANQHKFEPFSDYAGQTYVLALKAAGIPALRERPWLRYLELSAGYGSRNFSESRPALHEQRTRNIYLGVSLNLSELLGLTSFRRTASPVVQSLTNGVLEYVQVPGVSVFTRKTLPR
jgi:hypothetical protein